MFKVGFALAWFFLLCARSSHTHSFTTSNGQAVSVDSKGKDGNASVHVTGKDGISVDINTGKPITDYPSDVPLYEGKSMMDVKSGETNARVVALETPDSRTISQTLADK